MFYISLEIVSMFQSAQESFIFLEEPVLQRQ